MTIKLQNGIELTVNFHSGCDALVESTSLTDLFQVLGVSSDRTRAAIATLVIPVHLDCPSKEALASFAADDAIVTSEYGTGRSHVVTHHTRRTGHGRFVVFRVVRRRSELIGQAFRCPSHSITKGATRYADHSNTTTTTLSQLCHGNGAAVSVADDGTHGEH